MTKCCQDTQTAAETAVLVEALRRVRHSLSPNELAVEAIKSEDPQHAHFTADARMTRNLTYEVIIALDATLDGISLAAKEMLAERDRLKGALKATLTTLINRPSRDYHPTSPDWQVLAEASIRLARAALEPQGGEENE